MPPNTVPTIICHDSDTDAADAAAPACCAAAVVGDGDGDGDGVTVGDGVAVCAWTLHKAQRTTAHRSDMWPMPSRARQGLFFNAKVA